MSYLSIFDLLMTAAIILIFLVGHYFSDFTFQTPYMARNKSKSNKVLAQHVAVQTAVMTITSVIPVALLTRITLWLIPIFMVVNFIIHFATDWVTSRMVAYYFQQDDLSNVFKTVGMDQFIHLYTYVMIVLVVYGVSG